MHIVIAGGTGTLGRALLRRFAADGHRVQILSRQASPAASDAPAELVSWNPDGSLGPWAHACRDADVLINLTGASIGDRRWSLPRKAELIASRLQPVRSLAAFLAQAPPRPRVLISSSAVGYYGDRGSRELTEADGPGDDFLAELCREWELLAVRARTPATRVVLLRTGIVLDPAAGALAKMLPPFRLFAGGPFGSGRQYMSWIHRDDWVSLVRWAAQEPDLDGPINGTAPYPVTNAAFAAALGRALGRPAVLPAPAFALRLALGEMADALLLSSQRARPTVALERGFRFAFERVDDALADLLR